MLMLKSLLGVSKEPSNGVGDNAKIGLSMFLSLFYHKCNNNKTNIRVDSLGCLVGSNMIINDKSINLNNLINSVYSYLNE